MLKTLTDLRDEIARAIELYGEDTWVGVTASYGAYGDILEVELVEDVFWLVTDIMTG